MVSRWNDDIDRKEHARNGVEKRGVIVERWQEGYQPEMQYFAIHVKSAYDADSVLFRLSLDTLNLYGEGETMEAAKADLVDSVKEWVDIYRSNIDRYESLFDKEYKACMRKLMIFSNGHQ